MNTHYYALILAGGSGTRFWPLSRNSKPKQLLNIIGESTLLQKAIQRLNGIIPIENILILTNPAQEKEVRIQASELPSSNIIAEPCRRDTAPAIAYGISLIAARDAQATMVVIPSDQLIQDEVAFQSIIGNALHTAEKNNVLSTIGIKPTWPCPSYGYIKCGLAYTGNDTGSTCYTVERFCEKPKPEIAEVFLSEGGYSWNAGMFVWSIPSVLNQLSIHQPQLAQFIQELLASENPQELAETLFPKLTPISIDYALMEKADNVITFEATFDWDDVGSWISIGKYLEHYESNQSNSPLVTIDAEENIIFTSSKKQVALLGVSQLIVVETTDALLVADKTQADAIKKIVDKLPESLL